MTEMLTDAERFPLMTERGREFLTALREHPFAPVYAAASGNRLTAERLARVRAFEAELDSTAVAWAPGRVPEWLDEFVALCYRDVPVYRRRYAGAQPREFLEVPTITRAELSREPWSFVPDTLPTEDIIIYTTTGTTGQPLAVPSHPVAAGCYIPLMRKALALRGIRLTSRVGQVACVLVGYQNYSFTYASLTPLLDEAGFVKINLHPKDWRDPGDRARFLDALQPEIYTGDPLSFMELARLPLTAKPKALISTSMALLPALRESLAARFGCPVLDLYSLNESGPVGVDVDGSGYVLLQHRLYVEILDAKGEPCAAGTRGEITLSGGFNEYCPLLRYRTGDYAALEFRGGQPVLLGLEGRPPVVFRATNGAFVNNIDVTHALKAFALPQYTLRQARDGSLVMRVHGQAANESELRAALLALFGDGQALTIEFVESLGEKVIQYTSEAV